MPEPLIDLSNPESWRLLKQARKRGYLTRDEFDRMFGSELPPDRMEALKRELLEAAHHHPRGGDKR